MDNIKSSYIPRVDRRKPESECTLLTLATRRYYLYKHEYYCSNRDKLLEEARGRYDTPANKLKKREYYFKKKAEKIEKAKNAEKCFLLKERDDVGYETTNNT